MSEKTLKTRIQNKRGTTAEWATGTAPNFVPLDGELIVYKDVNKIKIGNGTSKVGDLPFVASNGLDALVFNGSILVGTVPSVGQTFSYGPTTSFNRTPAVGDNFIALIGYKSIEDDYLCQCRITAVNSPSFTATYVNVTKATGTDGKVKDVTLDGESIVNADGVVELHPTAMTDGYVPVWNNTTKVFEDGIKKTNIVTRDTEQTIDSNKTFTGALTTEGVATTLTNAKNGGSGGLILDCYELQGSGDSIFSVWAEGENKGKVFFGDGAVDVNINFGESYITSDMLLCPTGGKTAYPQTKATKSYVSIKTSASAGTFYYDGYIVRAYSNTSPSNINLPTSSGTLALTNQIPIKTATLSGTTLSITLE